MEFREINDISEIINDLVFYHMKQLPYDLLSLMGKKTVYDYYNEIYKWYGEVKIFKLTNEFGDKSYVIFGIGYIGGIMIFLIKRSLNLISILLKNPFYFFGLIKYCLFSIKMENELLYIFSTKSKTGLGSILLYKSIRSFKNKTTFYVKTLKKTENNIKFYEKNGFKIIKKIAGRIILVYEKS